jgi:sulfite exporter TauE/SafE
MSSPAWLVAAGLTLAASVHCLGMCGGFALVLAVRDRQRRWRLASDQILLHLGKATTYAFLGALAGTLGGALVHSTLLSWGGKVLALVMAVLLAVAGATLLGLRHSRPSPWITRLASLWQRALGPLLEERPAGSSLVVGLALGTLPCPLVYAGLAAAAASGSAAQGAAILAGVALGTVPALAAVALVGVTISEGARRGLARTGGVLLLVMALVTMVRAFGHEGHGGHGGHEGHARPAASEAAVEGGHHRH